MSAPSWTTVSLEGDLGAALESVPAAAGVGQLLGSEGRNLVIGRAPQLRRWAARHLGAGRPARKGGRPPTDLRSVARGLAYLPTTSAFHQRLAYERLMARHVPLSRRRDLKAPAFLHLDPGERFPRVSVRTAATGTGGYGPFRDRRAAERALRALHKLIPLRPCDYAFEPAPALPLGLGCLYAQVRSCAAPCLARITEPAYRDLARQAAGLLADPAARPSDTLPWLPAWVAEIGARAVVVENGRAGLELYPVLGGVVREEGAACVPPEDLAAGLGALRWPGGPDVHRPGGGDSPRADDTPWLTAWLALPRRSGAYLVVGHDEDAGRLAARAAEALGLGRG